MLEYGWRQDVHNQNRRNRKEDEKKVIMTTPAAVTTSAAVLFGRGECFKPRFKLVSNAFQIGT